MRLVSLAPSATEIVFALGLGDRLVGRTAFCDYPPEVEHIPALGGWTTANLDAVLAAKPDLVLTSTFLQDAIAAALRERGITVCHTDPKTLADVLVSFETIAAALGVLARGQELRRRVESGFAVVSSSIQHPVSRIYCEEWHSPPMASGNWVPDLIRRAGGISFLPSGVPSRGVTLDEVHAFDPDTIALNYCGARPNARSQTPSARKAFASALVRRLTARPGWSDLRAVRAGRVSVVDDSLLNRPGPRLIEGARVLVRALASVRAERPIPASRVAPLATAGG